MLIKGLGVLQLKKKELNLSTISSESCGNHLITFKKVMTQNRNFSGSEFGLRCFTKVLKFYFLISFACFGTFLHSLAPFWVILAIFAFYFAHFCILLHTFVCLCAFLCAFAHFCMLLHSFLCFSFPSCIIILAHFLKISQTFSALSKFPHTFHHLAHFFIFTKFHKHFTLLSQLLTYFLIF